MELSISLHYICACLRRLERLKAANAYKYAASIQNVVVWRCIRPSGRLSLLKVHIFAVVP